MHGAGDPNKRVGRAPGENGEEGGGEQYVLVLVVIIVLVVGILFFLPRGDRTPEDRWKEEDERFAKGMKAQKAAPGARRKKGGGEEE